MDVTGDRQLLKGSGGTISVTVTEAGATFGAATVTVKGSDGSTVAAGIATGAGGASPQTYTFTLTGPAVAQLDTLTAVWSFTLNGSDATANTAVEVVGAFLFTISEARAFGKQQLANANTFPDSAIEAARSRITNDFQDICGVSFIPRLESGEIRREYLAPLTMPFTGYPTGNMAYAFGLRGEILLRYPEVSAIRSVQTPDGSGGWQDYNAAPYTILQDGSVTGLFPWGDMRVTYEHGFTTVPGQIKTAALFVLQSELIPSNLPANALSYVQGEQFFKLSVANGESRFYGIPYVDSALLRYRYISIG